MGLTYSVFNRQGCYITGSSGNPIDELRSVGCVVHLRHVRLQTSPRAPPDAHACVGMYTDITVIGACLLLGNFGSDGGTAIHMCVCVF